MDRQRHGSAAAMLGALLLIGTFAVADAVAGEMGHYAPAPVGVRDMVMPPQGTYFVSYDIYYGTDKFKNSSGDSLDSLSVSGSRTLYVSGQHGRIPVTITGTLTVDLDVDVASYAWAPAFLWVTDKKFLGADYACMVSPTFGHMSVEVEATGNAAGTITIGRITQPFSASASAKIEDDATGFGDTLVMPLWLGWRGKHYDAGFNWAMYLPTGYYDKDNIANIGYGFFTNRLQANYFFYPSENKATAFMLTPTYEWHSKKMDEQVQPGQNVTLEYGISQYLSERFEIGISAYNQWQISDDHGSAAASKNTHDSVAGIGGQATYWLKPKKCAVIAKFMQEYNAKDRTEGMFGAVNVMWIF